MWTDPIARKCKNVCLVGLLFLGGAAEVFADAYEPPLPEPPVLVEMADKVVSAAAARQLQLASDIASPISPGSERASATGAVELPIDEVVSASFDVKSASHTYLLQPLVNGEQLTEVLIWTEQPQLVSVKLYDFSGDNKPLVLMARDGRYALSRLNIHKPTLLELTTGKGPLDYRLLWRTTEVKQPGIEHEPNSFNTTDPELVDGLPHMLEVSDNVYTLSGYLGTKDNHDFFVVESDVAALVTLESTGGTLGLYVGDRPSQSVKTNKRVLLSDILLLPGKNVFYIRSFKGDYSIKATLSPIGDRYHELEPNNESHLAHRLPIGQDRTGRLLSVKDPDYYFFNWPTSGQVQLNAIAGDGGDIGLTLFKDGVKLQRFAAAEKIVELVDLNSGAYELLVQAKKPSLQQYSIRVDAVNPFATEDNAIASELEVSVRSDVTVVAPFANKGQTINAVMSVQNNADADLELGLSASSSHDKLQVALSDDKLSVAAGQIVEVPFQINVQRSAHAFGQVPVFFSVSGTQVNVSATLNIAFPYDAPLTENVWLDQPLPEQFMGAFDVARAEFGAIVHHDETCTCTAKEAKAKSAVYGTDVYAIDSAVCPAAVHAGIIDSQGGTIRTVSVPGLASYAGSDRNGVKSRDNKKSRPASLQFYKPSPASENAVVECKRKVALNDQGRQNLFTGLPFRSFFTGESVAVNLVGDEPLGISGVILSLRGVARQRAKVFEIDVSIDGFEFSNVYAGELKDIDELQPFVFDAPSLATHVRVRLLNGFDDATPETLRLGTLQVMTPKDTTLPMSAGLNLANPRHGGHVFSTDAGETVFSFHHNRTALIRQIELMSTDKKAVVSVSVASSEHGPYGPWKIVGNTQIQPKSSASIAFDEPIKAKFIRITGNWTKPKLLQVKSVVEAAGNDGYRSILAQWGNQESDGFFELGVAPAPIALVERRTSSQENPIEATPGDEFNSTVSLEKNYVDHYRVVVPQNTLSVKLQLSGDPLLRARVDITDANGQPLDYVENRAIGGHSTSITVTPEAGTEAFFVTVYDTPKHLAILWDDSGSVSPYVAGLNRMLSNFAFDFDPRYERINLTSLHAGKPRFLLSDWAESPFDLLRAIRSYTSTGSSDAYRNMEFALAQLADVDGLKALLIMTDEQGDRNRYKNNKMEELLAQSEAVVFSFHATSSAELHNVNADHMQSWANIGGGRYTLIRSAKDVPEAIAKVQTWLRKPAVYQMQVSALSNQPGALRVYSDAADTSSIVTGAVEVILDASGSMWKKMADGQPRIVVAKNVLLELVAEKLPENLPFALRVFGHRQAKSCRTDLELPFGPLSRDKAVQKIKAINPQDRSKTPIGDSLAAVVKDLKKATGKRIVILITDGEETCDSDPQAVIRSLKDKGFDVQVNIVGFAIDDANLKAEFAQWAKIGGGDYFDTNDAEQLIASLQESLTPAFTVISATGDIVAQGRLNGVAVELPPGDYVVKLAVDGYADKPVFVLPAETAEVSF